ncbi:MAG: hypothetical protein EOO13_12185, partial [Chitinophagaceae bacterium]
MLTNPVETDMAILDKIRSNDLSGWEELYDKYACQMLTIICKLSIEKKLGEEILIKIFTEKKFEDFLSQIRSGLTVELCNYAFRFAASHLHKEGLSPDAATIADLPKLLQLIYANELSRKLIPESKPFR